MFLINYCKIILIIVENVVSLVQKVYMIHTFYFN